MISWHRGLDLCITFRQASVECSIEDEQGVRLLDLQLCGSSCLNISHKCPRLGDVVILLPSPYALYLHKAQLDEPILEPLDVRGNICRLYCDLWYQMALWQEFCPLWRSMCFKQKQEVSFPLTHLFFLHENPGKM